MINLLAKPQTYLTILGMLLLGSSGFMVSSAQAQSNNCSDCTLPNLTDTGTTIFKDTTGGVNTVDRQALDAQLVNPNIDSTTTFNLQIQQITNDYVDIFKPLRITLQMQGNQPDIPVETIASLLTKMYELTGNNAEYTQISLTQNNQVVITRIAPNVNKNKSNKGTKAFRLKTVHQSLNFNDYLSNSFISQGSPESTNTQTNSLVSRYILPPLAGGRIQRLIRQFRSEVESSGGLTRRIGKELYDVLIKPIEGDLQDNKTQTLVLALNSDLIGLPVQALNDGKQYLVEKYALSLVPSFGLTDIGYTDVRKQSLLAMGSSEFREQAALPAVPIELQNITRNFENQSLLNTQFTVNNFVKTAQDMIAKGRPPGIIHVATHGEFSSKSYARSYIQFDDQKLSLIDFHRLTTQLGWDVAETAPELMVLSACRTAVGDAVAELGFGGVAVASGAKSVLASLWYVSDLGTLALMNEFYHALLKNPIKSQALRQAQLKLLTGETKLKSGQLILSDGQQISLPPDLAKSPDQNFTDPFYWAAFTLIGNWN
jgi:CHAT domain-containing protein